MMNFATCGVMALFLLLVTGASAQSDETYLGRGTLRNDKLNFAIANTVQNLYFDHVNAQNDIAVKYGSFGPDSISGGAAGVLDMTKVGAMTLDLMQLFTTIGTEDMTYTDSGFPGQEFSATGAQEISQTLASVVAFGKVYGQYHVIGHATVDQIGDNLYRVGGSCDPTGRIFPDQTPGVYPTSAEQVVQYHIYGHRYHVYERVVDGSEVSFKLKAIQGYGRMSEWPSHYPLRYSEVPFGDIQ